MKIEIEFDDAGFQSGVQKYMATEWVRRVQLAIDTTLVELQKVLQQAVTTSFRDPVPYTRNAFGISKARPLDGNPEGMLFVYDKQAQYLALEVLGGERRPGDYATTRGGPLIPLPGAPKNEYGDLPRGFVGNAIRDHAFWLKGKRPGTFFLAEHGSNGQTNYLAVIVPEATYRPDRLDFSGIVAAEVNKVLPEAMGFAFGPDGDA